MKFLTSVAIGAGLAALLIAAGNVYAEDKGTNDRSVLKVIKVDSEELSAEENEVVPVADEAGEGDDADDFLAGLLADKDWNGALEYVNAAQEDVDYSYDMARFILLILKKDSAAAMKLAGKLGDKAYDDGESLNEIAWYIATADGLENRDLALADKFASRANELCDGEYPPILDTLARIKFMRGEKDSATELQQKAVDLIENAEEGEFDESDKATIDAALKSYQEGKLPVLDMQDELGSMMSQLAGFLSSISRDAGEGDADDGSEEDGPGDSKNSVMLPDNGGMAVVAMGEGEPNSIGSYSIRLYSAENPDYPFDNFLDGQIQPRAGGNIEGLLLKDVDGDGKQDVVVTFRCVGSGSYLSADAFSVEDKKLKKLGSLSDQAPDADVAALLAFKLKPSAPGTKQWFDAVEAVVGTGDDQGGGPDLGSDEWLRVVGRKMFETDDGSYNKNAPGTKEWYDAVNKRVLNNL